MALKLLLIEDEALIREVTVINLSRAGFDVFEAANGEDGVDKFNSVKPSIVLLDINLPGINGFEVCRRIREKDPKVGVIMLTARSQEFDRINGLKSGADDYVTKPFSPAELIARIEALARRMEAQEKEGPKVKSSVVSGPFVLDLQNREILKDGEKIDITQTEFLVLNYMMENEGKVLSRREIFDHVWQQADGDLKIVDVNVRRLRLKLEKTPSYPAHIQTVWGTGYIWFGEGSKFPSSMAKRFFDGGEE